MVWPRKPIRSAGKERSAAVALVLREAFSSETDPAGWEAKKNPRRNIKPGGGCGLDGSAVFGSSPQPSGLPEPAGRFHRGATRGELDSIMISGEVELDASK